MKKIFTRYFALLLLCITFFGMVACDKNENAKNTTNPVEDKTSNNIPFSDAPSNIYLSVVKIDDKYGLINEKGDIVVQPQFAAIEPKTVHGLIPIVKQEGSRIQSYIDTNGVIVVGDADAFYDYPLFRIYHVSGKKQTMGICDRYGNILLQPIYSNVFRDIYNGCVRIELNDQIGYYNCDDNILIEPLFDRAGNFQENGLAVVDVGKKFGIINKSGNYIVEPIYDSIYEYDNNGYARAEINNKKGYLDANGNFLTEAPVSPDNSKPNITNIEIQPFADRDKEKFGFKDENGNIIIEPKFEYAWPFSNEDLAVAQSEGKLGYIDKTGTFVIEPQFDSITAYHRAGSVEFTVETDLDFSDIKPHVRFIGTGLFSSNGLGVVSIDGKYGFIDKTGNFVIPPQFDGADHFSDNHLAPVKIGEKWGFIDENQKFVIEPQFDSASSFFFVD